MKNKSVLFNIFFVLVSISALSLTVIAQEKQENGQTEKQPKNQKNQASQNYTAEQIVETSILIYGSRQVMEQIRKTSIERGKIKVINPDGSSDSGNYEKRISRGAEVTKDKIRLDQKFPSIDYALVQNEKIFGILDNVSFSPKQEAQNGFEAQIYHSLETLLRYKENGSKIEVSGKDKQAGVEFYLIDVTDKENRKTRFLVSSKFFKIMSLSFEKNGIKYERKFKDYRYAQGTLVAYKTETSANGKLIEENQISTITFGQKVDDGYFSTN